MLRGESRAVGWETTFIPPVQGQEVQSAAVTARQPGVAGKDPVPGSVGAKAHSPLGVARAGWKLPALPLGTDMVWITAPGVALLRSSCRRGVITPQPLHQ